MNASLKYATVSYQKMLVVAKLIKGKNVSQTLALLDNSPKKAGKILSKVVKTAYNNVMTDTKKSEEYVVDQVVVGK
jgi:large subunit ribosomal protein L22